MKQEVKQMTEGRPIPLIVGFTACGKMHGLLEIATSSFGFAMTTYVAQNLGANKMNRPRRCVYRRGGSLVWGGCGSFYQLFLCGEKSRETDGRKVTTEDIKICPFS